MISNKAGLFGAMLLAVLVPQVAARAQDDDQPAPDLPCVVKQSNDVSKSRPEDKSVSTYISTPVTASIGVDATGWGDGDNSTGSLGVEILQDNVVVKRSDPKTGEGRIDVGTTAFVNLTPGNQTKISARLYGQNKNFRFVRMHVRGPQNCPF